ncbi:MAG: NADH-quinone oxidoreductase subunit C [Ktedonobacterales bacterium]
MDLARDTRAANEAPSLLAYDRDHITDLLNLLAQVDEAIGSGVPKTRLPGGIVGIVVPSERLLDAARIIRDNLGFEMLTSISGVDMIEHVESVYHFRAIGQNWLLQVRVKLPNAAPEVDSLVSLYPSANWLERETYDLFGITFRGHPDLRRILLDDEFFGYPLLKSVHQTPLAVHDRATTQTNAARAVAGEQQRMSTVTNKHLGQGMQERLHPGKVTFGSAAVFLETGQGVESGGIGMHGYTVNADTPSSVVGRGEVAQTREEKPGEKDGGSDTGGKAGPDNTTSSGAKGSR